MQSRLAHPGFTHHEHANELQGTYPIARVRRSTNAVRQEYQDLTQRRAINDQQALNQLQGGGVGTESGAGTSSGS